MRTMLAIAVGGALGSVARYAAGAALAAVPGAPPAATLLINVVGSLVLGAVVVAVPADGAPVVRAALAVGVCGGFTTFSTFSAEVVTLVQRGQPGRAALYALVSVGASVAAAALGMAGARAVVGR